MTTTDLSATDRRRTPALLATLSGLTVGGDPLITNLTTPDTRLVLGVLVMPLGPLCTSARGIGACARQPSATR
jgi:hypothetical protein